MQVRFLHSRLLYTLTAVLSSVKDIHASLTDVWTSPLLSAYLHKNHDQSIASFHGIKSSRLAKTRRKAAVAAEEPDNEELQVVKQLQAKLDVIPLSSWK